MAWRIHLANQAIQQLHMMQGRTPALIAWTRRDRAMFYAIETGALLGEKTIPPLPEDAAPESDAMKAYVGELYTYDERSYLPFVRLHGFDLYATSDGKKRLYHLTNEGELHLEKSGERTPLEVDDVERFISIDVDAELGTIAALDEQSRLHLYHDDAYVDVFDLGLEPHDDLQSRLVVSRNGEKIFATDGRRIVQTDLDGHVVQMHDELHYLVGQMACSPNGGALLVSEIETGVIRLYRSDELTPTHQRFGIDLVADANQVQLMADMPPPSTAVTSIVAHDDGVFAFTMLGVICASDIMKMTELPRPQALI